MAYSEFTLESAKRILGVVPRPADLFPGITPADPPAWLPEALTRGAQGIHLSLISEKSRSEFVVAPILLACRELSGDAFAVYSGGRLDVDSGRGLAGECDFLLAAADPVLPLQGPIAVVVEAKKNDIEGSLGQCIAQMVAAVQYNGGIDGAGRPVFGCVTTGEVWQFLKAHGDAVLLDRRRFYIDNVGLILGIFGAILAEWLKPI